MEQPRILVIIPTFNEAQNIVPLIDRLLALYAHADVLVVDDSSRDGTAELVRAAKARYGKRLDLLVRQGKGGRGSAVLEGFRRALDGGYTYGLEMDADFSHRPEEIALFLPKMGECDCVIGSRYLPGSEIRDWGWKRTVFSGLANRFARFILRMPLSDYTNGFRCYTRRALQAVEPSRIDAKGYVVLSEVAYQLHKKGMRFGEVPTLFVNRRRGVSNLGFHEINEAFFSVLRIRWPRASVLLQDAGTFVLRGALAALIDLAVLWMLTARGMADLPALVLSGVIATGVMALLRQRRFGAAAAVGLPMETFVLLYGVVGVLAVLLALALRMAGAHVVIAKALAIVILSPVSYVLSRRLLPR